jgi:2,3-bisphosphoglycerate-independent phosphoglycerate mutase
MNRSKKIALFIIDGAADRCLKELGDMTPLEKADTPNLDMFARLSSCGTILPRSDYLGASTDLTHFFFLGFGEQEYPGRSVLELLAAGKNPQADALYLSCLLAASKKINSGRLLIRESVPFDEEEVRELYSEISRYYRGFYSVKVFHQKGRYGILELRGPVERFVPDTDPFKDDLFVGNPVQNELEFRDRSAAQALVEFLRYAHRKLKSHPVNQQRIKNGLPAIDTLVTKWPARKKNVDRFSERTGMKGAIIASGSLFSGMARLLGMDFFRLEETDTLKKVLALVKKTENLLMDGYDFVLAHIKDVDEISHIKNPEQKVKVIEQVDRGFGVLFESGLLNKDRFVIAITADHPTPSTGTLIHSGEKTPLAVFSEYGGVDRVDRFNETDCKSGRFSTLHSYQLMPLLLNLSDRIAYSGSSILQKKSLSMQDNERILPLDL